VIADVDRTRYAVEPESIVHLTLPPGAEGARDYEGAARTFRAWIDSGVLRRDPEPRLYVLYERTPEGPTRRGFFTLVRLADYGRGIVLPHERTLPGPKEDRLRLTRAVCANLEPLFFLYADRDGRLNETLERAAAAPAVARARSPQGAELALFELADRDAFSSFQEALAAEPLVIADGHHRYETMLRYRDECRERAGRDPEASHEFVLGYLVNAMDPGTQVRAIHRIARIPLETLQRRASDASFRVEPLEPFERSAALIESLASRRESSHAFVVVTQGEGSCLFHRPRGDDLDVEQLHSILLHDEPVRFEADPDRVLAAVRGGEGIGLLLNPVAPEGLFRVVQAGRLLPQKSTYFSPKVPSGLVIRDLQ
jgi:uncharacterized protein (DUF1015 family)